MADLKGRTRPKISRDWSDWKPVSSAERRRGWRRGQESSVDMMGPQLGRDPWLWFTKALSVDLAVFQKRQDRNHRPALPCAPKARIKHQADECEGLCGPWDMNPLTPVGVWTPGPQGCRVRTQGRGPGRLTPNSFTETESEHWGQEEGVGTGAGVGSWWP